MISKNAIISPKAEIGKDVIIKPFSIIGKAIIGDNSSIGSNVVIEDGVIMGKNNIVSQFVSLGGEPQDKKYKQEKTFLEIGDNNIFREFFTAHRGSVQGQGRTKIGNNNYFMNYSHVAHDSIIGNYTIFTNYAVVAGCVVVEDYANLAGFVAIYQNCRIGKYSFITGGSLVEKDVLPYTKVSRGKTYAKTHGLNLIGLKRFGFDESTIKILKKAYKIIHNENLTISESLEKLKEFLPNMHIEQLINFIVNSNNGIIR